MTSASTLTQVTSSPSALKQWHTLVNARIETLFPGKSAESIARSIHNEWVKDTEVKEYGLAYQISLDQILPWVVGKDVPRETISNEAFLRVLKLEVRPEVAMTGPSKHIAATRNAILDAYKAAIAELGSAAPMEIHCNGIRKSSMLGSNHKHLGGRVSDSVVAVCHDAPYMPKRMVETVYHGDMGTYEELDEIQLQDIVDNTQNAGELLRAWRMLQPSKTEVNNSRSRRYEHMSLAAAAELFNQNHFAIYQAIEVGQRLPSAQMVDSAMNSLAKDPKFLNRFIELSIKNRLAAAEYHMNPNNPEYHPRNSVTHMKGMPIIYWREALQKTNHPSTEPTGDWRDIVNPLQNKGEYLRALRYVFELNQKDLPSAKQIAPHLANLSEEAQMDRIEQIEYDRGTEPHHVTRTKEMVDALRESIASFYEDRSTNKRTGWFNRDAYEALPQETERYKPQTLRNRAARSRHDNGQSK